MEVQNLEEGQIIKNYPELCKILGIPKKTSNSKKAQLKELKRFVKFRQSGHSFIIDEIYSHPKDKIDRRGKKSIYGDMIQLLVMDYLINIKKPSVTITRNMLLEYMKMINFNYNYCSSNIPALSKYAEIDEEIIYDFFTTSKTSFKFVIENALNNLRDRSLITWNSDTMVCDKEDRYTLASIEQKEQILACEKMALTEMRYNEISQVAVANKWGDFRKKVYALLRKNTNIKFYFSVYNIVVNREFIESSYNSMLKLTLDKIKREQLKDELNITVYKQLLSNAKNRQKNFNGNSYKKFRVKFTYKNDNEKLINMLIRSEAENITKQLEEIKFIEEDAKKEGIRKTQS